MGSLKRLIVGLLASLGGVGAASIGGLPGIPKGPRDTEEQQAVWIDWGGADLGIPEILQSQQAFEAGVPEQALYPLTEMLQSGPTHDPNFEAQLLNNLAVSASTQGLREEARAYIEGAAGIETDSLEIRDAVDFNLDFLTREQQRMRYDSGTKGLIA